jgi:hypothetical protein
MVLFIEPKCILMPRKTDEARSRYEEIILEALWTNEQEGLTWTQLRKHVQKQIVGKATLAERLKHMLMVGSVQHEGRKYRLAPAYLNPYLRELRKQRYHNFFTGIEDISKVFRPSSDPRESVQDAFDATFQSYVKMLRNLITEEPNQIVAKEIFDFWLRNEAGFFLSLIAAYLWYTRKKVPIDRLDKLHITLQQISHV